LIYRNATALRAKFESEQKEQNWTECYNREYTKEEVQVEEDCLLSLLVWLTHFMMIIIIQVGHCLRSNLTQIHSYFVSQSVSLTVCQSVGWLVGWLSFGTLNW